MRHRRKPTRCNGWAWRALVALPALFVGAALLAGGTARPQEKKPLPRVLILGDSISLGYTEPVRKLLSGTADVSRPKENCQHTATGLAKLKTWLGDGKWDVIHFNWGIWDTHMLGEKGELVKNEAAYPGKLHIRHTPEQYKENLTKLVGMLEKTGAKLVWASTTPVLNRTGKRLDDVKTFNAAAEAVMRDRGIPINDLYGYALPHAKEWQGGDRVHFTAAGSEKLAERVAASIREALGKKSADAK